MLVRIITWSLDNRALVLPGAAVLAGVGAFSLLRTPLDAIPDLADVQVVLYTEHPGQAPRIVEDQVTYPLTTQMLSVPYSTAVRGYSFFGYSLVHVLFEDGTDLYWARSRVLESLSHAASRLPLGVTPTLGPDATGVGWAFIYALTSDRHDLSELRSIQDWFLKYELSAVPGVAEVASLGGFVRQYQITVDPRRLRAFGISIAQIRDAVRQSNGEVGGRLLEVAQQEFMVRGRGYIESLDDIRKIAVGADRNGTPLRLEDVARVNVGPEMRRGLAEWDGRGEAVGGIVVVRHGADTREVIAAVKARIEELRPRLPEGVTMEVAYDRTGLIDRAVGNLRSSLGQQLLIVGLVSFLFLFHVGGGVVAMVSLPLGILIACIATRWIGVPLNIMSLGGVAVAVGTMVDAGIVLVENTHRNLAQSTDRKQHWRIVAESCREVGPPIFFSLLVITVSFAPVFMLEAQEGRLFRPLAWTKTAAMGATALLSVTVIPVLVDLLVRGRVVAERRHPMRRALAAAYIPVLRFALRSPLAVLALSGLVVAASFSAFNRLGSEFMPPLWEGDLLYMPTTLPGISITAARELLQQTDRTIKAFPEVAHVFGKVGRAETATDPAPLSMIETTVLLEPREAWRPGMTPARLVSELHEAIEIPGLTDAWTMPVKARIDMLSTGIRTPVGIKIGGPDLQVLDRLGRDVERVVRGLPGTLSAHADRSMGGNYVDIDIDRDAIAREGLTVAAVQDVIETAIGGMRVTTTVEGLERYPVNLRYGRDLRDDLPALRAVLVPTPAGTQVPLGQLADLRYDIGPPVIKSENARPNAWVHVDIDADDLGGYVEAARRAVEAQVEVPAGYTLDWSGQYESLQRVERRLRTVIPLTLAVVVGLIYLNTRSILMTLGMLAGVPLATSGSFCVLYLLDYNMSVAVWVGVIALAGLYAETAIVFLFYLDASCRKAADDALLQNRMDLVVAIYVGAVSRVRPIVMTIATDMLGLAPVVWSTGAGADVMKRIATPLFAGILTSGIAVLVVLPVLYYLGKSHSLAGGRLLRGFDPTDLSAYATGTGR